VQDAIQQRGLAGAEKPGQQGDRDRLLALDAILHFISP
jgi:hypothetical protein